MGFNKSAGRTLLATLQALTAQAARYTHSQAVKQERDKALEAKLQGKQDEVDKIAEKILRMTGKYFGTSQYTQKKFLSSMGIERSIDKED